MSNAKATGEVPVPDPLDDADIATAVMQVVFDLAREALRQHDDLLKRGFAMPDVPHDVEVHALLELERVPVAPVKGSVEVGITDSQLRQEHTPRPVLTPATAEDVKRLRLD